MPKLSSTPLVILSAVLAFTLHCGAQETAGAQAGPAHAHNRVSAATFPRQRNGQPGRDAAPAAAQAAAQNPATSVSVDANAQPSFDQPQYLRRCLWRCARHRNLNAPLNRWGGNSTSRYNWQIDAPLGGRRLVLRDLFRRQRHAGRLGRRLRVHHALGHNGAEPMFTIPMIDYLANLGPDRSTLEGFSVKKYGASRPRIPGTPTPATASAPQPERTLPATIRSIPGVANSAAIQQAWVSTS